MDRERPAYLRFVYAAAETRSDLRGEYVAVVSVGSGQVFRLSPGEFELAGLFDGKRNAESRRAAAAKLLGGHADAAALRRFTDDLAQADLLEAGSEEPIPAPRQLDDLASGDSDMAQGSGMPPSSMPGSLAGSSMQGALHAGGRGHDTGPRTRLPAGPAIALGAPVTIFVASRWLALLLVALAVAALYAVWHSPGAAARQAQGLLDPIRLVLMTLSSSFIVNLVVASAQAAAVAAATREKPGFGLRYRFGFVPQFVTDVEGPAERADARGRIRILASALCASLTVFTLAAFGWAMLHHTGEFLPLLLLNLSVVSMVMTLVRLNPLAAREGYLLLAHWADVPDLRERAWMALFGWDRPWTERAAPPKWVLRIYAALVLAYIVAVLTLIVIYPGRWLENLWAGTGVLVFVALIGANVWSQIQRLQSGRSNIGNPMAGLRQSLRMPSRTTQIILGIAALVALFPYTYEASGGATVLPVQRADVRALISADIREVRVKEGDQVEQGAIIARLADDEEVANVASSRAGVERLRAQIALAEAGNKEEQIRVSEQRVETARVQLRYSEGEARRLKSAYERRAVSVQDYDRAEAMAAKDRSELVLAQRNLELVRSGTRQESLDALHAELVAGEAHVRLAEQRLKYTELRAPIAGQIVSGTLMFGVGQYMHTGDLLAVVEDRSEILAEVRMPQSVIGDIELGAAVTVKLWAYSSHSFPAVVRSIAPAAEETREGKIVRVMVAFKNADPRLKSELTGQAKITGDTYPLIVVYTRALVRFILVEVWSWLP